VTEELYSVLYEDGDRQDYDAYELHNFYSIGDAKPVTPTTQPWDPKLLRTMNTASKLGPHTQTDRGTCPGVGL